MKHVHNFKAREFLYYKIYGKQCITPVAIMTSAAKNNHERVTSLCKRLAWFGRGQSSFQFFEQVLLGKWWGFFCINFCMIKFSGFLSKNYWFFHNMSWTASLLFLLLAQRTVNGWLQDHIHLSASLVDMASFGNLLMTKASTNGSMIMAEKVQLSDKSG